MSAGNVKLDVQVVTPLQANEWLSTCQYKFQRTLKMSAVEYYAQEMAIGDWDATTVLAFGRVSEGEWHLIDGQHRLAAVVKSNTHQPFVIKRVTYNNDNDLADAYARMDQGVKRTPGDQARAWQLADHYGLPPSWLGVFQTGLKFLEGNFGWRRSVKSHPKDLRRLMDDYQDAMQDYYGSCVNAEQSARKPLLRSATVSVGLVTFRFSARVYGEDKVSEFWQGVALDDGLRRGDPRKTAHDHLLATSMAYGTGRGKTVTAPYSARWLASCFNAWAEGRNLQDAKPDVSRPINILGSPFNGK